MKNHSEHLLVMDQNIIQGEMNDISWIQEIEMSEFFRPGPA